MLAINITFLDWIILAFFFVAFLWLAVYLSSYARSVAGYLVSERKIRMWLGMGAGIAGEIGLVSIAAICEQGYMRGFAFVLIGIIVMAVMVPLFGFIGFGIERFRASKAMSVPQYIEMRYSKRLRILTGIFNSVAGVLQMSIFPIVGAHFVRVLIGAPEIAAHVGEVEIQSAWIIMAILLMCNILFTYFGGYITLIVSNFFQMILIVGTMYYVLFDVMADVGLQAIWTNLEETRGLAGVYPFTSEEGTYGVQFFVWLLLMSILLQFSYGPYLQKYASMDKPKTVSRSYLLGTIFGNGRTFVIMGLGVVALAVLGTQAPESMEVSETLWNRIATPYYLATVLGPGLMGLVLASLLFADISTTDQYLLSWSTSIVNDCIVPFKKKPFSPKGHINVVRLTIIGLCGLFFLVGLTYSPTLPIWEYLWLCANIIGGTGIAVLFGMYWKRATTAGAYAAVLTNLCLPVADLTARQVFLALGREYPWTAQEAGLFSYLAGIVLLIVVSLLSGQQSKYWDLGRTVRELNLGKE